MSVEELRRGLHGLAKRLYSEEMTDWRRENFKRRYFRPAQ